VSDQLGGIWSAVLTPVTETFDPDPSVAVPYYRELLERGCSGLNLLGTTGEAMSFSAHQRVRFMEAIASSGLPKERLMAGTGAASLDDAAAQTRAAFDCGLRAALVMAPFFFREVGDEAVLAFFEALLTRVNPGPQSILLYNFPRMSGIAFSLSLIDRLVAAFGNVICGMKDSSNDAQLQAGVLEKHPRLKIFPGSESDLLAAKMRGAAGCISGSVALWPELACEVFAKGEPVKAEELRQKRAALDGVPFVPSMRYLTAASRNEPAWLRPMPPQPALTADERQRLLQRVSG
jgi:4-hydroxy-tetrahydrodipicolinate synthase